MEDKGSLKSLVMEAWNAGFWIKFISMTLHFDFDLEDWMAFQKHFVLKSKRIRRTKLIMTVSVPAILGVFIMFRDTRPDTVWVGWVAFVLISGFWVYFYPRRFENRIMGQIRKTLNDKDNSGILGAITLELGKEEIVYKNPESERRLNWNAIKRIGQNEDFWFLYDSAVSAIIIPKSKIDRPQEEVWQLLQSHMP